MHHFFCAAACWRSCDFELLLFGNTNSVFKTFESHGIEITFVDATNVANVAAAIKENTKLVFVETIANPRTQVADLINIGDLCEAQNLLYCVDNTMTTPYLFQAKGITQIKKKGLRDFGATLGPEAAHHISIGSDTLALRMERACENARTLTEYLSSHDSVKKVYYPGLSVHPQHQLSTELFKHCGA